MTRKERRAARARARRRVRAFAAVGFSAVALPVVLFIALGFVSVVWPELFGFQQAR